MLHIIKCVLAGLVRLMTWPLGPNGRRRMLRVLRQGMDVGGFDEVISVIPTARGPVSFYCLGNLPLWRAQTLLTKEPETIKWIDEMADGDVLYDIGANVGGYTIYAAINRKTRVVAFEPLPANYYLLNKNIEENNLADTVSAYCVALNNEDQLGKFHAQDTEFGSALSSFGEAIEQYGQSHASDFEQGMIGLRLDSFIENFSPEFPTHIKIDVDGIEEKIIAGALKTISDPRLKSIQIELDSQNLEYVARVTKAIETAGLIFKSKQRSPIFDGTPVEHVYNFQFYRKSASDKGA